jgi:uncharacterized protein YfbU (UPF0304 family)
MKLSMAERLILANQYRILSALEPKESAHLQAVEILQRGYRGFYNELIGWFDPDEMTEDECAEVIDILSMFRLLNYSYRKLEDTAGIDAEKIRFKGFDANEEPKQYSLLVFMVEQQRKWGELKSTELNSHWPVLNGYRRMVHRWEQNAKASELTKAQILSIIAD